MNKLTVSSTKYNKTHTSEVFFDGNVYRWVSNNRVPPADAIIEYGINKLPLFNESTHEIIRGDETFQALEAYAENMKNWIPSDEDRHEMRAAFGSGAEIVNIITGKKYKI